MYRDSEHPFFIDIKSYGPFTSLAYHSEAIGGMTGA